MAGRALQPIGRAVACAVLLGAASAASAQESGWLVGQVIDQRTSLPVAVASVSLVGSMAVVALVDETGSFVFADLPPGEISLRVEAPGYLTLVETVEVVPGRGSIQDLQVMPLHVVLEGLLVLGRRADKATGSPDAVISVRPHEEAMTVAELLSRRVPGLVVNRAGATLGSRGQVRLRGPNSLTMGSEPLVVVDGVPVGGRTQNVFRLLDEMPASQVESIRVIRGPSAVYGESANGVILIQTKSRSR